MCSTSESSTFIAPNICRCCHSSGFYTDISAEFNTSEGKEIYEDVLNKTFNIQLISVNRGLAQSSKQICNNCINKVLEAYTFRNMVIANECKLLEYFESVQNDRSVNSNNLNQFEHADVKSETYMKEESIDDNNEHLENETSQVFDDDVNVKEEPSEGHHEEVSECSSPLPAEEIILNTVKTKDKPEKRKAKDWSTLLKKRGPGPILRENSLKLLENSTMFPFQYNKCTYLCVVCKEAFFEMAELRNHNLTHSKKLLEKIIIKHSNNMIKVDISTLFCKKCGKNMENLNELRDHLVEEHNIEFPIQESLLIPYKIENEGLKCQICSETFNNFRNLNMHVNRHYKNHICDTCGVSFSSLVFLNLHKTRSHRKHLCRECNIHFDNKTKKNKHDIEKHEAIKEKKLRFVCSYCDERFSQENIKIQHLVDNHGLVKPEFKCQLCVKVFITKSLCNNHMRNVHKKEKKHECDVCNNFFYTKSDLARHRVTHTGEKNFSCALCSTLFATKDSLRRHIKRSHN